jgi:hypothetical protein
VRMRLSVLLVTLLACAALSWSSTAWADDDVIILKDGGRLRGLIMEEQPGKLVRIKLADDTVREISAADIGEIHYGAVEKPVEPPGPAPAATPPPVPPPPVAPPPAPPSSCVPGRQEPCYCGKRQGFQVCNAAGAGYSQCECLERFSAPLIVAGVLGVTLGPTLGGAAVAVFVDANAGKRKEDQWNGAIAMSVIGGALFIAGIPMLAVGARKVSPEPDATSILRVELGPATIGLSF